MTHHPDAEFAAVEGLLAAASDMMGATSRNAKRARTELRAAARRLERDALRPDWRAWAARLGAGVSVLTGAPLTVEERTLVHEVWSQLLRSSR